MRARFARLHQLIRSWGYFRFDSFVCCDYGSGEPENDEFKQSYWATGSGGLRTLQLGGK